MQGSEQDRGNPYSTVHIPNQLITFAEQQREKAIPLPGQNHRNHEEVNR
jgi:hypothetical protein